MGSYLLSDFKGEPELELLFVMIIFPLAMNSIQVNIRDCHKVMFIVLDPRYFP
jgi:hypothetical protein